MTLTKDEQAYFKTLWDSGVDINPICHRFGISVKEMNQIAHELGLIAQRQFRWDEDKEAQLNKYIDQGLKLEDMAKLLGCSRETIKRKKYQLYPPKNYWRQPGKVQELEKLVEEGLSASQIARAMGGTTRNAIIGKVHRLGLEFKCATGPRKRVLQPAKRLPKKADTPKFHYPETPIKTIDCQNARHTEIFQLKEGEAYVSFAEHKDSQCRCIKERGDKVLGYCARLAEPGSSYCREHGKRFERPLVNNNVRLKEGQAA